MIHHDDQVLQLFPPMGEHLNLKGLYLGHRLGRRKKADQSFVYTNFISSLDGRISLPNPKSGKYQVPSEASNPHDIRLFYELIAQADVIVTTARHLRAVATGKQPDLLNLDAGQCSDLIQWRESQGMSPQPRVAVISKDLELPEKQEISSTPNNILVFVWRSVADEEQQALRQRGYEVVCCGEGEDIDGNQLVEALRTYDFRNIYSIAGPRVFTALLKADKVDRLYLTIAQLVLGGEAYHTLTYGKALQPPQGFQLAELYYDPTQPPGSGQLLAVFDRHDKH